MEKFELTSLEKQQGARATELSSQLLFEDWGLVEYELALKRQLHYVQEVQAGHRPSTLVFCTHPAVVTLGRAAEDSDCLEWRGKRVEVSRGGRATYHGPSQLVVYPIMDLNLGWGGRKPRDIVGYLRGLEDSIITTLGSYGVHAVGRSLKKKTGSESATEETGVWVGERKLASLGIGVKRWVAFHGAAINLEHDPNAFQGLRPCGFSPSVMVSLEEILGTRVDRQDFANRLREQLLGLL